MTTLGRGWFHLASGAGVGRVLGFASNLLLSRWLGPTELGLFNLLTTTVQTSDTLVRCGGDYALNFELGGHPEVVRTERGGDLARGLGQLCSLMTVLICIGVAIWVWFGQGLFPVELVARQRVILSGLLLLMIAFEGTSASAWEVMLVSHRTAQLALRNGLFFPFRLLSAATGALLAGLPGAMMGWLLICLIQAFWLKYLLGPLWKPLKMYPLLVGSLFALLRRGLPFYAANLLASMIFYPLLMLVAAGSGLTDIGYLRVGQILQQLFAFLPATLVPVLFLKLRGESSFADQVTVMEKPLRIIWCILLEVLLLYCLVDHSLISWLFGSAFISALIPTRLLLITALFECLAQLVVQPLLAAGKTRMYGFWQNSSALLAAVIGWLWIPFAGLAAYLVVRLLYVVVPLIAFGAPVAQQLHEPRKMLPLVLATTGLLVLLLAQALLELNLSGTYSIFVGASIVIFAFYHQDLLLIRKVLRRMA